MHSRRRQDEDGAPHKSDGPPRLTVAVGGFSELTTYLFPDLLYTRRFRKPRFIRKMVNGIIICIMVGTRV